MKRSRLSLFLPVSFFSPFKSSGTSKIISGGTGISPAKEGVGLMKAMLLLISLFIFSSYNNCFSQTVFTATSSGNWTTYSWSKSGTATTASYPGQPGYESETHDVVISGTGVVMTLNGNISSSVRNVTVTGAALAITSYSLTMTGNLSGTGAVSFTTGTINIAGNNTTSGAFSSSNGTMNYNGNDQTVRGATYYNLVISGSNTKTLSASTVVNHDLTINSGILQASSRSVTVAGTTAIFSGGEFTTNSNLGVKSFKNVILSGGTMSNTSGSVITINIQGNLLINNSAVSTISNINSTISGTTTVDPGSQITFGGTSATKTFSGLVTINGTWDNSANEAITVSNDLVFNGTNFISGNSQYTFNGIYQNLSGSGPITFDGTVSVSASSILNNKTEATLKGALTGSGSWRNDNGSVLNFEGITAPDVSGFNVSTNSNIVNYSLSGDQEISNTVYFNLQTSGSGIKTLKGAVTINGDLSIGSGTTLDASTGNYSISVHGSWLNDGTFNKRQGTVSFSNTGPQAITKSSGTAETFYNLVCNTIGPVTSNVDIEVNNLLTMTSGKIIMPGKTLTLGTDASNPGGLSYTSGWVTGTFARWINSSFNNTELVFPIGTDSYNRGMKLNFQNITTAGVISSDFISSAPSAGGLPLFENIYYLNQLFPEGYWDITRDGLFAFSGTFDLKLIPSGFTTFPIDGSTRIVSRYDGNDWILNGNHVNGSALQLERDALTDFTNNFAVAYSEVCTASFLNCPADVVVEALPGQCNNVASWVPPTMSVACPNYSITSNYNPGDVFNVGTTQVVYKLMNGAVEVDFCSFNVLVTDNTVPQITCANDQSRNVDAASCYYTVVGTEMDPVFTFNNCPFILTNDLNGSASLAGAQIPVGKTTVLWTIAGLSGTSASCSMDITVIDNIAPSVLPVPDRVENVGPACTFVVPDYSPLAGITDNCGTPVITQTPVAGTILSGAGTTQPVTITATDADGNSTSISFSVTLADITPPVAICRNISRTLDASGNVTIVASDINNGSTDNCGLPSLNIDKSNFTCADLGPNNVTLTVTDASGNSSSCVATVTITDNVMPAITCPANINQNNDPGLCAASVAVPNPVITDNCAVTTLTWSMTGATIAASPVSGINQVGTYNFNSGITTITYIVKDGSGNQATCSFTVTVTDTELPSITCPGNIGQDTDPGVCTAAVVVPNAVISDNCAVTSLTWAMTGATVATSAPSGINQVGTYNFNSGITTVTYTVKDGNGNQADCSFIVTIADNQVPSVTCPADISKNTDPGVCTASVTVPDPVIADNCSVLSQTWSMAGATVAASAPVGINQIGTYNFNSGLTIITYTVKDAAGNQSVCSFNVTVNDNQTPSVTCPADIGQSSDPGVCTASVVVPNATASDNCSVATLTWNMTGATVASSAPAGINQVGTYTFNSGITTITYTVKDGAGNQANCSFTVTVTDSQLPAIACPADIIQNADPGVCTASVVIPVQTATDNCSIASLTWAMTGATIASSPASGINQIGTYNFNPGITTITYTAKDLSGNQETCSFKVTVADNQAPSVTCPSDIGQNADPGVCTASVVVPDPVTSDNCSVTTLTWDMTGATVASSALTGINKVGTYTFNTGITTVTYIVKDGAGNQASCSFLVTITDNQLPSVSCPSDIGQDADAGVCTASVVVPDPVISDNCSVTTVSWDMSGATVASSPAVGINMIGTYTFNEGITNITYTVKDGAGNQSVCSFTVTVTDTQAPAISCPGDIAQIADPGVCTASIAVPDPIISDNCSLGALTWDMTGATVASSAPSGINMVGTYTFNSGITTVTYLLKDGAGNQGTCSFTVSVTEDQAPVITCPSDIIENAIINVCSASVAVPDAVISDNCGVTTLTWEMTGTTIASSPSTGINQVGTYTFNSGLTTVTYIAKDGSGNQATCSFTVTVNVTDNLAPVITCPSDIIQDVNASGCTASVIMPVPVTSDNCGVASVTNSFNGTDNASGIYPEGITTVIWTVTDVNGNTATCSNTVTINSTLIPQLTSSDADNSICLGDTVTFTASGGTIYEFLVNGTSVQGPGPQDTYTTSSMADQDKILVSVTDAFGCNAISPEITTTVNTLPSGLITSQADVLCFGDSTGSFDLTPSGGTSPYSFLWDNGSTDEDPSGLPAGNHFVTITDANGCSAVVSGVINQPAVQLSVSIISQNNVTVIGGNDGDVTVAGAGGIPPYQYKINSGSYQASGYFDMLAASAYIITVQDANLCTSDIQVIITQPSPPLLGTLISKTDVLCFGSASGSITVTGIDGVPPYEYSIDGINYQTSGTFNSLTAQIYTVKIRDAILDIYDIPVAITQPAAALTIATTSEDVLCSGGDSGSATSLASGGTGNYSYSWNTTPVQTTPDISGLTAGTYTITVTDDNACIASEDVIIGEPQVLSLSAVPSEAECPDSPDGSIELDITGGTTPYAVIWSDGISTQNRSGILPGTYSVVVTDANGCAASDDIEVAFTGSSTCLEFPDIITPNNDGYNDEWRIRNIDLYPNAEVKIYTRWGKLIYHTRNIAAHPWDGRYQGKLMPTDSYHYILFLNDGSAPRSGVISVIR